MKAPVIRIGMTPEELAQHLVERYADFYATGSRQTEASRTMYVVHGEHLDGSPAPPGIDALHEAWKSAAAEGADLVADCTEGWALVGKTPEEYVKEWHTVMNDLSLQPDRREVLYIVVGSARRKKKVQAR
jgi:hypothetical protein